MLNCLEFGMSPADAVTAPRFSTAHHIGSFSQPPPKLGSLTLDEDLAKRVAVVLEARGHKVSVTKPPQASPCVLNLDLNNGLKQGAGDPKARRFAGGY